jgi:ElaB/YqjD/DUF883 family membrane-anchored ribosome-binding protein
MTSNLIDKTSDLIDKAPSVDQVLREVSRIKEVVTEAVEDGVKQAVKAYKDGRQSADDIIHDTKRMVKQKPLEAVGIVFAVGVLTGALLTWAGSRRR